MNLHDIQAVDPGNMYALIKGFPDQVREAVRIGNATRIDVPVKGVREIVLCGLGGSAIAGDLLKSYLASELPVPFLVNRQYSLPAFVGPSTLVIISSYSGNTEETITAHREAIKRRAKILCISSNGVTGKIATARKSPAIRIPAGFPPRAALGFSFFPLLIALSSLKLVRNQQRAIAETIALLDKKSAEYADPESACNLAMQIASQLQGRLGVIYSSTERFDAVNTRWRGQLAENAKTLCFGNVLPEMNHNELVGWKVLDDVMREIQVIFLRDKDDHTRVQIRMDITKGILGDHTPRITEVWSEGRSVLARMFSLVYLGDWVSLYLAVLHGVDPTPVSVIDLLKRELAKV